MHRDMAGPKFDLPDVPEPYHGETDVARSAAGPECAQQPDHGLRAQGAGLRQSGPHGALPLTSQQL